ncbi:hypothetical protein ACQVRV_00225 (plasmid) [Ralstonia pseudosolanacearum]
MSCTPEQLYVIAATLIAMAVVVLAYVNWAMKHHGYFEAGSQDQSENRGRSEQYGVLD